MGAPENDPRLNPGSLARKNTMPTADSIPDEAPKEDTLGELPSKLKNYNEEMARPSNSPLRKPSFSAARNIGISNHSGLHIILPSSAARATSSGSLTDLNACIVDMSIPTATGAPFPGLAVKNIANSLIVAGRVNGPVHITGVKDSILVIISRQVRIHECSNVDIYLQCSSHPIIEDCSGMRFAPLPAAYVSLASMVCLIIHVCLLTRGLVRRLRRTSRARTSGIRSTISSGSRLTIVPTGRPCRRTKG